MFRDIRPVLFTVRQRISLRISPPLSPGILTKGKDQTEFNNRGRGEKAAIDLPFSLSYLRFSNGYI